MDIRSELLILRFTGAFKKEGDLVFATCNEAPLVGCGESEDKAYEDMTAALDVYIGSLSERGELLEALKQRKIPFVRIDARDSFTFEMGRTPMKPVPAKGHSWLIAAEAIPASNMGAVPA